MTAVACAGWVLALAALATATALNVRFRRHGELVAQACHELRGALCVAQLGAEALEAPGLQLDLRRAGLALADLDASRSNGRGTERREVVDLGELASNVSEAWGSRVALGAVTGAPVLADPGRLAQAVGNLVANALEHGGPVASVAVRRCGSRVRIEVADTGPGLPAPISSLIADARGRRGARGHGLGVVARIAASHGGRLLTAPSEEGARMVIELPALDRQADHAPRGWRGRLADPEAVA